MIEQILSKYMGKQIKVHLGPDWNYFGVLERILEKENVVVLRTDSAVLIVALDKIVAMTHVPASEIHRRTHQPVSAYHPAVSGR